jgi:hypothetical protein
MGGSFIGTGMKKCDGDDVINTLNDAFEDPKSDSYKYAMKHNTFDSVLDEPGNYKALILAYVEAGVDVCARWGAYLRVLGGDADGQHDIFVIAQTRYKALTNDVIGPVPMQTSKHDVTDKPHGGKRVQAHDGSGPKDPSTIDSPFTP